MTEELVFVPQVVSAAQSVAFCVQTYNGVGRRLNSLTASQVATYEKVLRPHIQYAKEWFDKDTGWLFCRPTVHNSPGDLESLRSRASLANHTGHCP